MKYFLVLFLTIAFASFMIAFLVPQAYGVFHREDFIITGFGIKDGNLAMSVVGEAGRSFSIGGGDETYYSYTFVTDKGIFASTVSLDEDGNKPYYSVDHFDIKNFKIGECVNHKTATGEPKFSGKTVEYVPKNLKFGNITKAYTIQVTSDDPDEQCESGNHIYKIFSSK